MKRRETAKNNLIYKKLSNFRKDKQFSYDDLIRELNLKGINMHKTALYNIEHNRRSVKDFELKAFSEIFKKKIDDFFEKKLPVQRVVLTSPLRACYWQGT